MEGVSVSNWNLSNKHSEEESIESYLKAWDAIKTLEVGPSHVNLAAEIANMFVKGGHYANMVHFVNSLDDNFLDKMKENEKFVRALLSLRMTQRKYNEVFSLLEVRKLNLNTLESIHRLRYNHAYLDMHV